MKNSLTNTTPSGRDIQSGSGGHNEFRNLISHFWNFFDNPTADSDLEPKIEAVSYTHLTLPTIRLV